MGFIQLGEALQNAKPEEPVPEGEYRVRVVYADANEDKGFVIVRTELTDHPFAKEVGIFLNLPGAGRTEKEENRNMLRIKEFYECFSFDPSVNYEVNNQIPEGWVGAEGWVILGPPIDKGDGYGPQNNVRRFIVRR